MRTDERGLPVTTSNDEATDAFNAAIRSFFSWRTDAIQHLNAALEADPQFALAHAMKGLWLFGLRQPAMFPVVRQHLEAANANGSNCTERERLYLKALDASLAGNITGAVSAYEQILFSHPTDLVAIRLAQYELFWLGEANWARDISERAADSWSKDVPGYSVFLAIQSFGKEEAGQYEEAERLGRLAIEIDPGDCWAAHAVAHVLEMQGRLQEGIDWLDGLKDHWQGANNIVHHLWWHRCLFASEMGDHAGALRVYDQSVRNPDSPLVQAMPDFFIDIQNCAAFLLRLDLRGIDVGERWEPIADIAESRIGNHASPFTSAHCAIALVASGRNRAAAELMGQMRSFAKEDTGTLGPRYAVAVIPAAEGAMAHRCGEHEKALEILMPVRRSLWQMGGSHAQRDLFFQIIADSAARLGRRDILAVLFNDIRSIGFGRLEARTSYAGLVD